MCVYVICIIFYDTKRTLLKVFEKKFKVFHISLKVTQGHRNSDICVHLYENVP